MVRRLTGLLVLCVFTTVGGLAFAGTDPADKCVFQKAKAVGKKAQSIMKALGKNISKNPDTKLSANVSKAQSKLTKAFTKAESKGACPTTGDAGAIEAKTDGFIFDIVDDVSPTTTTTNTTGATTSTTGATTSTTGATTSTTGATTSTTGATTSTTGATTTSTTSTTLPFPTCTPASPYPACDGSCPPGTACTDPGVAGGGPAAGFCDCVPLPSPGVPDPCAASTSAPACWGDCPPGTVCQFDGAVSCICAPMFEPCGAFSIWPICDGSCPPGLVCQDAGFPGAPAGFCACTLPANPFCGDFPDGPPECYGPCPPGEICIFDGAAMCECVPGSPSGAFLDVVAGSVLD